MKPTWQTDDGAIQLYLGDCLDVLPTLGKVGDSVVTDPPYSIQNKFGTQKHKNGTRALSWSWDQDSTPDEIVVRVGAAIEACRRSAAVTCWCGSDQVGGLLAMMREHGFTPKMMAWVKKCPPPAMPGNWWPSGFELGIYGYRHGAWFGDSDPCRSNVWVHDSYRHGQPGKVDHPTQKPLALIQRLVQSTVAPGGVAVDGFMGSGTTGVACIRTGRRFIGIEKEPKYFEIAKRRILAELNRTPLFDAPKPAQRQLAMACDASPNQ